MTDREKTIEALAIPALMEQIRELGPSWKTDVVLTRSCHNNHTAWSAEARDVWGHMHTPIHYGISAEQVLNGVLAFVQMMVNHDGSAPCVDDDGRATDCESEIYLEPELPNGPGL